MLQGKDASAVHQSQRNLCDTYSRKTNEDHCSPHPPPVEAAMLQELQKTYKQFRNLEALVLGLIREEYGKSGKR